MLLIDHINAGLWLPPGGHVEPDEHPAQTVRREALEELGIAASGDGLEEQPAFLTVTRTVGIDAGHTDVSLWFGRMRSGSAARAWPKRVSGCPLVVSGRPARR